MVFNEAAAAPAVPGRLRARGKVVKPSASEPKVGGFSTGVQPPGLRSRGRRGVRERGGKAPSNEIVNGSWMH